MTRTVMEKFDLKKAISLESQYDDSLNTRPISAWLGQFTFLFSIVFAVYHYVTSGIGVPVDYWHMGAHMSGVLVLIFISFPAFKSGKLATEAAKSWWHLGGVPIY
ncbi:MAG: TRAP transporter permease, partial [Candidatus Puniceispirillum sp.]